MLRLDKVRPGDKIKNKKRSTYTVISNDNGNITAIKVETINKENNEHWDEYMMVTEMTGMNCQKYDRSVI